MKKDFIETLIIWAGGSGVRLFRVKAPATSAAQSASTASPPSIVVLGAFGTAAAGGVAGFLAL